MTVLIMREIEEGDLDPNAVDALHFRLNWLQGLIVRLLDLYGIDEQIVNLNLIRGARDCLIGSQDIFSVSSPATAFPLTISVRLLCKLWEHHPDFI